MMNISASNFKYSSDTKQGTFLIGLQSLILVSGVSKNSIIENVEFSDSNIGFF